VKPAQAFVAEGGEDLARALERLAEPFRSAVVLRDLEELSYQDIARILEVPVGTVMSRIHRGRAQLRQALVGGRP
jgi:RNA polymerase sigma-70 factor (ECF subfamily)